MIVLMDSVSKNVLPPFFPFREGLGIDPDAADVKASSIQDFIDQIKKPYPSRSKYRSIKDW